MHRRAILAGGALAAAFGLVSRCACVAAPAPLMGCRPDGEELDRALRTAGEFTTSAEFGSTRKTSGNGVLDRALAHTLAAIATDFGVLPGFAFFDEGSDSNANAYASPSQQLGRADGSVFFGLHLLRKVEGLFDHYEDAVACICAHEFGHIVQFRHGLFDVVNKGHPTVKRSELQADYMAGFFAGLRKRERPSFDAALFAYNQHSFGDIAYGQPDHHGTAEERGRAVVEGFTASFDRRLSLTEAVDESTRYVIGIRSSR